MSIVGVARRASILALSIALPCSVARAERVAPPPEVEARLLDAGRATPACGRVHAISVAQFELTRTITGTFSDGRFWVAFSCESLSPRAVGRTFRLRLSPRRPWATGAVFWPRGRPVAPLYWSVGSAVAR